MKQKTGIWKGLGFEKLGLKKDIKAMRKEFNEGILRRSKRMHFGFSISSQ